MRGEPTKNPNVLSMENSILIVDGDERFGKKLVGYFKRRELYARFVSGANVARHLITAMSPAVAIVDYCGEWGKVAKLCDFIRRAGCPTEVILTCGRHSRDAEKKARLLSPAFYFAKPFNEEDLFAVVLRILEKQSQNGDVACFFQRRRGKRP
jgi:DNA-binding NtrC family response regulator